MLKSRLPSFKDTRRKSIESKPHNENKPAQATTTASLQTFATGDRVIIGGARQGVICYFGTTHFAAGEWYGIELDAADGKHNGEVDGHRYFTCKEQHGIFAPKHKVEALKIEKSPPSAKASEPPKVSSIESKVEAKQPLTRNNDIPVEKPSNLKKSKMLSKSSVCLGMSETLSRSPKKTGKTTLIKRFIPQKLSTSSSKDTSTVVKDATAENNSNFSSSTPSRWSASQFDIKPSYETMSTSRFRLDDIFYEDDADTDNNNLEQTIAQLLKKPTPQFAKSTASIAPPIPDLLMPSECHVRPSTSPSQAPDQSQVEAVANGVAQSADRDASSASFGDILNELELSNSDLLALEAQQCTEAIQNQDLDSSDVLQLKVLSDNSTSLVNGDRHIMDAQSSIVEETSEEMTVDDDVSCNTSICSTSENVLNSTFTSASTAMEVDEKQLCADEKPSSTVPVTAANSSRNLRRPSAIAKFSTFVRGGSSQSTASATSTRRNSNTSTKLPPPAAAKKSPPVSKPPSPDVMKKTSSVALTAVSSATVKPSGVTLQRRPSAPQKSAIQKLQNAGKVKDHLATAEKSKKLSVPSSPVDHQENRLSEESSETSPEGREKSRRKSSIPGLYQRRPSDTAVTSSLLPRFHTFAIHGPHHLGDGTGSKSAAHSNKSSSVDLRCKSPVFQSSDSQLSEADSNAKYGSKSNIPILSLKRKSFVDITDPELINGHDFSSSGNEGSAKKALSSAAGERRLSLAARAGSHPDVNFWHSRHGDGHHVVQDNGALLAARQSLQQAERCKEALLLVIRHATQQTENVSTELCKVKVSNDELRVRQTELKAEIASVREAKQQQMRMWWQAERDAELAAVKQAHLLELQQQAHLNDQKIAEMETAFAGRMRLEHDEKVKVIKNLQQDNSSKLDAMKRQHEAEVNEMNGRFECLKSSLMDSVNSLQGELHELKQREKVYMETLKQSSNDEVQAAVACFQQLPLELDGLRVVLDMRTQEVHNLRGKIVELERQLEELTAARDIIKAQQQKIENLQAVVELRQEYERDLTEKHRVLLRKYDQESKQLKRLSMNNEQMAWRLSMGASEASGSDHETLPSWAQRNTPRGGSVSRQLSGNQSPLLQ